jgi:thioester reductase-like protein
MNGYGPTETTVSCTMSVIKGEGKITIGKPNANVTVYIVNTKNKILPPLFTGEMVICGDGVGRGYVGLPDKTAEVFITLDGKKAYKSGDKARWTLDGEIEFHGRLDNQVKLRGLRVELGEIEEVLNSFPSVITSIVTMHDDGKNQFLAGYFTAETELDKNAVTEFLAKSLSHYMIPGVLMQLPKMPLNANGKIDKTKLPEPVIVQKESVYIAPETAVEKFLCGKIAEILGLERVSVTDDFFEIGGTSLSATKLAMFAFSENYGLVYADIFKYTTARKMAQKIEHSLGDNTVKENNSSRADDAGKYDYTAINELIKSNDVSSLTNDFTLQTEPSGNILITGSTGFLGIHVLRAFLENYKGKVYCLIRGKDPEARLQSLMMYYFDKPYLEEIKTRVICIAGDITNEKEIAELDKCEFSTVINCAANVKHFSVGDLLNKVNVLGVNNLISLCKKTERKLIQISTTSVAGEVPRNETFAPISESKLFFGQRLNNDYVWSKFLAERNVLSAVCGGLRGKIIRAGNLMSRSSDGEFQINFVTNGFMRQLRGYKAVGKFPVSCMGNTAEFSPIDSTATAILKLAETKKGTIYHAYNNHVIFMSDVIYAMNKHGFKIDITADDEFEAAVKAFADKKETELAAGLIAYVSDEPVEELGAENDYTAETLYRLNFKFPMISENYLENSIKVLDEFGFFEE